jgi:hypothetical protein
MSYTPDYRGVFLRGYGSTVSTHYGTVIHSSGNLGELQGDAIRNITGNMSNTNGGTAGVWDPSSGAFQTINLGRRSILASNDYYSYIGNGISLSSDRVVPVANENRPINRAVRYLIKAT